MHPAVALLEHQQALNRIARQARAAELALLPHLERELRSMRYAMYTGAVLKDAEKRPPCRPAGTLHGHRGVMPLPTTSTARRVYTAPIE
jgi:hypothetical protein